MHCPKLEAVFACAHFLASCVDMRVDSSYVCYSSMNKECVDCLC